MLKLLRTHWASYLRLNPVIVACFLLGSILAGMTGLYAYGNLVPWTSANSPEQIHNKYFSFYSEQAQSVASVRRFYETTYRLFPIRNFTAQLALGEKEAARFTLMNGQPVLFTFQLGDSLESDFPYRGEGEKTQDWFYVPLTTVLEHREGGEDVRIVRGSRIHLFGRELRCIGESNRGEMILSAEFAEQQGYRADHLDFLSEPLLSDAAVRDYLQSIERETGFRVRRSPLLYRALDAQELPVKFLCMIVLLIVSVFSYGFLAHFLVSLQWKNHVILYIYGYSLADLRALLRAEVFLYSLLSGGMACLLYIPLYRAFLHRCMLYREVNYRSWDYLFVLSLFIFICMTVILPFVRMTRKKLDTDRFLREV